MDSTTPPDIAKLLEALEGTGADFALGSRFLGDAPGLPWTRRLVLKGGIVFTRLFSGSRSQTRTTGRGADLVLYAMCFAGLLVVRYFYTKNRKLELMLTEMRRREAISSAERGKGSSDS